ncbi:MAG: hypothetical protein ACLQVM_16580 [Terriglobia bacterium]
MSKSIRVRAIGRGLVILSLIVLPLRIARYLVNVVTDWAGYLGGVLFVVGVVWIVGSIMVGYTEQHHNNLQA